MNYLESITLAGSHAKGTALRDSDIDLFLRYSPDTPGPISALQTSLADRFHGQVRNVSVRIAYKGLTVLSCGKRLKSRSADHSSRTPCCRHSAATRAS